MKSQINLFFLFPIMAVLVACGNTTPEKFFGITVLNTNLLYGFAGNVMSRQLESPSSKLVEGTSETVPMSRAELIESRIKIVEENYDKVKGLKETDDGKEILETSKQIYELVLPVYKNEYMELARLYDNGAAQSQIDALTKSIHDKYSSQYDELNSQLVKYGKLYADKHGIKVNWGDN